MRHQLPAVITPGLSSKERSAAVAQDTCYKVRFRLQRLADSGWVTR